MTIRAADATAVVELMGDLERFINDDSPFDADPLIKMALADILARVESVG
ncbi:MAG: hypothetical protein HY899_01770 [Deltaproteobacteria bacterium]|nr:hypothetical protein [Deltaproteobacteria bacterium]